MWTRKDGRDFGTTILYRTTNLYLPYIVVKILLRFWQKYKSRTHDTKFTKAYRQFRLLVSPRMCFFFVYSILPVLRNKLVKTT